MESITIPKIIDMVIPPTNIILDVYKVRNLKFSIFNDITTKRYLFSFNFPSWFL